MNKQIIPIDMIDKRKRLLMKPDIENTNVSITYENVNGYIDRYDNKNMFNNGIIKQYLSEQGKEGNKWKNCLNIFSRMSANGVDAKYIDEAQEIFTNDILPTIKDIDSVTAVINGIELDSIFKDTITKQCDILSECDRLIRNNDKLTERFNFNQIISESEVLDITEMTEYMCKLIDTYDISVNAKLNIALENALYVYNKNGIGINKQNTIQTITEYFLRTNNVITDNQYSKICRVLENNRFISEEDISGVYYLFNKQKSFSDKILEISNEIKNSSKYSELIEKISKCKTIADAKEVIEESFSIIYTTYIAIEGVVDFDDVKSLLASVFYLVLKFSDKSSIIINKITEENNKNMNEKREINPSKYDEVYSYVNLNIANIDNNPTEFIANIVDDEHQKSKTVAAVEENDYIVDFDKVFNILESKDFADSDDVKELIDSYKADQNKSVGKIKKILNKIYTKSPNKIIDDLPNFIEFVRNFGILGTLAIHPVVTLISLIVDKSIEIGFKRTETEKVLKHFKTERAKIDTKIVKAKGEEKERLEEYLASLDKSIDKLEYYRDDLYSDTELDRIKDIEESTRVHPLNRLTVDEYLSQIHKHVIENIDKAITLFNEELYRKLGGSNLPNINYATFDLEDNGESRTSYELMTDITREDLIKYFLTPGGLLDVPLFRITANVDNIKESQNLYEIIFNVCSFVNSYLAKVCLLNVITIGDDHSNIFVIFNYMNCLYIEKESADHSATYEVREAMATILSLSETVEDISVLEPDHIMKDLFKNIDKIVGDDIIFVASIIKESNINSLNEFVECLKDLQAYTTDPIVSTNLMSALDSVTKIATDYHGEFTLESFYNQTESLKILNDIVTEAKAGTKKPVEKIKTKIKDTKKSISKKVDKVTSKADEKKIDITTDLGLAAQALKNKMSKLSTKEKEVSRNVDINLSQFKRGIERALTTDKRESIIKGSIIPSFSKMIKTGMAAGALYLVNPVVAAIASIGALATSKALTHRERQLLLDEIDIELKAVEKEISMAESDGEMQEYRHLLTYQKRLQREYQRIRYRIKMSGKDNIPSTEKGDN